MLNENNEYYVVNGWFDKTNGLNGDTFYGAVATPDNYLTPKRVVLYGQDAVKASQMASKQPARVFPHELTESVSDGQFGDGLNPKEREDTQALILDREQGEEELKTWRQIQQEYDAKYGQNHHHLRLECPRCGNTQTCRCMNPKTTEVGLCDKCAGEPVSEMTGAGGIASATNTSFFGMPDRGGHGRVDNLGPKKVKPGRNFRKGLKGFGNRNAMKGMSQSGGIPGGNKHAR